MSDTGILQVVNGEGEFNENGVNDFVERHSIRDVGVGYQVVAITGPQSSGKSTLMNALVSVLNDVLVSTEHFVPASALDVAFVVWCETWTPRQYFISCVIALLPSPFWSHQTGDRKFFIIFYLPFVSLEVILKHRKHQGLVSSQLPRPGELPPRQYICRACTCSALKARVLC